MRQKLQLTLALLLAVVLGGLSGCGDRVVRTTNITMPSWACTQTPTGAQRTNTRQEYCGKGCMQPVDHKEYEVKVECKLSERREE